MKRKKNLTREEKIQISRDSLSVLPTTTRVKAWTFVVEKQNYVILSFFMPRAGDNIEVYKSNRKGIYDHKISPVIKITNSKDHEQALEESLEILIPPEIIEE